MYYGFYYSFKQECHSLRTRNGRFYKALSVGRIGLCIAQIGGYLVVSNIGNVLFRFYPSIWNHWLAIVIDMILVPLLKHNNMEDVNGKLISKLPKDTSQVTPYGVGISIFGVSLFDASL